MNYRPGFPSCTGRCLLTCGCDCPHAQQGATSDSTPFKNEWNDFERGYEQRRNENEAYISSLESQLSAKEQEITDLKTCVDNFSDMYQEKCIELASVRAENERLKKTVPDLGDQILGLRKRCEDLEALNYEFQDTLKSILDTSEMVPSIKEEAEKLLNGNQIKS